MDYPQIAQRLFNTPLLIAPSKARAILGVLAPRLGIGRVRMPDGGELTGAELQLEAAAAMGSGSRTRRTFDLVNGIAHIPVEGTLVNKLGTLDPWSGMTGYDGVAIKLRDAMADPEVRGILFDIESPGGEVAGLFDLVDEIRASRQASGGKPIWAMATEMAFSAAYAIASAADFVFLPRTGGVGSIGVVTLHVDWSQALTKEGITVTFIFAGAHKVDGNPFEPLPDAVRADVQAEINEIHTLFVDTVALGREGLDANAVRATEARIFTGGRAVTAGLADAVQSPQAVAAAMMREVNEGAELTAA